MEKILFIVTFPILILTCSLAYSQNQPDTSRLVVIETSDGNMYSGKLVQEDSLAYMLKHDKLGILQIPKAETRKLSYIQPEKIIDGKLWLENPQSARYFWAPNGYGLRKGEIYYQNIWVLWNQFSMGLTNNISIGAGIIPLFLFGADAAESSPIFIVPKVSIPVIPDQLNLGLGALTGKILSVGKSGFGILYGTATLGNRNRNLSLGLGYGYAGGNWAKTPLVNVSFMLRTTSRSYLLSENYFMSINDNYLLILSFGGRSFAKRVGFDYGLFIPRASEMEGFFAFPWLGFTVPITKGK